MTIVENAQLLIQAQLKILVKCVKKVVTVIRCLLATFYVYVYFLCLKRHFGKFELLQNCGHFIMCVQLRSKFDPFLSNHIVKYSNPDQDHTSYLLSSTYEEFLK